MNPNEENMIVAPITKRIEIVMGIQLCLILRINFDCKENGREKAFPANPKHQYYVSQNGQHDYCANNRKNGDYYKYPSLLYFTDEL